MKMPQKRRLELRIRADERKKIRREVKQLKINVNKTIFQINNMGISASLVEPKNKKRILIAKRKLRKLVIKFNKFAKRFAV